LETKNRSAQIALTARKRQQKFRKKFVARRKKFPARSKLAVS